MSIKSFITTIGATVLLLTSCTSQQDAPPPQAAAIPVIATSPEVKDVTVYMSAIGTLQPSVHMEIRPQASGTLTEVFIAEGQVVQKGTPLFLIDPKPYAIKVQEMEALLAADHANLRAINKKLERFRELAQKDLIAETEWDELEAQYEKSQAALELNQARLESAKLDLDHCTLRSPIDGRIGKLDAHPGHLVANGQAAPLVTISKMDPLLIEFSITEKEFLKMPKDTLKVQLESLCARGNCHEATVTFLDNQFDSKTGLLLIRGEIKNADGLLRPGQSVKVQVPVSVTANAKLIPQKAIRYNQEGPYVYVVGDDMTVANRQILLGIEHGNDQIVLEGLDPTERIILDGHLRLSPGIKVEIKS